MTDRDPTPPDLADLFKRESRSYAHYEAGKGAAYARVLERAALVAPLLAAAEPLASGAREAAPAAAAKVSAKTALAKSLAAVGTKTVVAAALALGGGIAIGRATAPKAAPASAPAVSALPSASVSSRTAASHESTLELPTLSPSALPNASLPTAPSASAPGQGQAVVDRGTLAKERELIEAARTALARGRPADALAFAERHARDHARGQLAEEREVLAITSLESLGRRDDAWARRKRFARAFPDSVLLPPVTEGGSP